MNIPRFCGDVISLVCGRQISGKKLRQKCKLAKKLTASIAEKHWTFFISVTIGTRRKIFAC